MRIVLTLLFSLSLYSFSITEKKFKNIEFLDTKVLSFEKVGNEKFFGISALEYDKKRKLLYMLSDRARLFTFKLNIKNNKIASLKPIGSCRLKNLRGKNFFLYQSDSEGISRVGDSFYISFESSHPKILRFKNCKQVGSVKLPKILRSYKNYQGKNRTLESLEYNKKFGLITSPEKRLKKTKKGWHTIFNSNGKVCSFEKDDKMSLVDFESDKDENLIGLFRRLDISSLGFVVNLKKIYLKKGVCKTKDLATLKTKDGDNIDNFEGIVRVDKNLYLMVSDDNDNFFEKTLLTLFLLR